MKKISTLLVFLLLMFSCGKKEVKKENKEFKEPVIEVPTSEADEVVTREIKEEVPELIFTVQIAALKKHNEDLISIDGIKTYQENDLTKYRLGSFKTYNEAREFRLQIIENYRDAFVQALKNEEPISILDAL
jgi:hypothetical protein